MSVSEKPARPTALYSAISQGHLSVFHRPVLTHLQARGYLVAAVANSSPDFPLTEPDEVIDLQFGRNPLSLRNLSALRNLIRLMRKNNFTFVHCHTPVASALTRIASLFCQQPKPIVVYTAHGFHFYPRASWANWLLWFSIEWLLTRITNVIVVINSWDEHAAQRLLRAKRVLKIPGMGVDLERFKPPTKDQKRDARRSLGINDGRFVMLYVAEMIPRKNHAFVIDCLPAIIEAMPDVVVLFAGDGPLEDTHKEQCKKLGISSCVRFLGFRRDVDVLCHAADLVFSASRHEGLPINIVEAMASGLPIVASEDRGHQDLVVPGESGHIFGQEDSKSFVQSVLALSADPQMRQRFGHRGRELAAAFSLHASARALSHVYDQVEALAKRRGLDVPG